jgi:hypothetical protein
MQDGAGGWWLVIVWLAVSTDLDSISACIEFIYFQLMAPKQRVRLTYPRRRCRYRHCPSLSFIDISIRAFPSVVYRILGLCPTIVSK